MPGPSPSGSDTDDAMTGRDVSAMSGDVTGAVMVTVPRVRVTTSRYTSTMDPVRIPRSKYAVTKNTGDGPI